MLKQFLFEINPTTLEPIRYIDDNYSPYREVNCLFINPKDNKMFYLNYFKKGFIEANLT